MQNAAADWARVLEDSLADDFKVECIDVPDCPIYFAVAMPNRPSATGSVPRLPCGRGLTRLAAIVSALGEAAELRAGLATQETILRLGRDRRAGLAYLTAENLSSGAAVDVLAQRIFLDWADAAAEPEIFRANTSGCAAWRDLDGATERGLLECIERDARALWWHGKLRCPRLPQHCLDDVEPRLSWWLQQRRRSFVLTDITCDTLVPAVVAASWEPDGSGIAIGTAAAPTLTDASLAATTEMLQTELAMTVGNVAGNDELHAWTSQTNALTLPQFAGVVPAADSPPVMSPLVAHLRSLGLDAVRFDFTRSGDVLCAVRMTVPGLGGIRQYRSDQRIMDYIELRPELTDVRAVSDIDSREPY